MKERTWDDRWEAAMREHRAITTKPKPAQCGACQGEVGSVFYDCYVPQMGMWANICHACFRSYNCKLGVGRGQKYNAKGEKVAG
jgi:hypothetical protein